MMKDKKRIIGPAFMVLLMLFFYLPIIYIVFFSFNESSSLTHFTGFSLRWYERMFNDSTMMEAVVYTVVIAVIATVVSTVVGTITAIGLSRSRAILRKIVGQINDFPIMNPEIVTAIGLLMFFSTIGAKKGFLTLLLAHIMFCTPYVILSVMPKIRSLDPNLADAALDLGATPWQALIKIIVPQIMPGIVSGALIAFTMSFDDFIISYFVTGNGVQNISILVYTMSKRVNPSINALSTLVIFGFTVVLLIGNIVPIIREKQGKAGQPISKKVIAVCMAVVVAFTGFGLHKLSGGSKTLTAVEKYGSDTLKLYIPGEYMDEGIVPAFEEEFGVDVIVEYFDSNEMMYTKIQAGDAYDILVPSDYMIQRLLDNEMLQPLDKSLIPNMDNLSDKVLNLSYDPDNSYSVPYFWGSVGLVYNRENVPPELIEEQGFEILRNTDYKGRVYVYDSERDAFMLGLKALGYSMNTENEDELQEAFEWLLSINNTMEPAYVTDEVIDNMINGNKDIAVVYSGDATTILCENEEMGFTMPAEGTNLWCDAMVIPENAENPLLAHEFINYLLNYDVAYANTEYVGYASPHKDVIEDAATELFDGNEAYMPRSGYELDEVFTDNEVLREKLSEMWLRVKASK